VPQTANPFAQPGVNPIQNVFIVYTPPNAASGFVDMHRLVNSNGTEVRFHIDGAYADPQYSFEAEPVKTDSSLVFNASLALAEIPLGSTGSKATITLWSRNLFDETHIYRRSAANSLPSTTGSLAGVLGDYGNFNPPREFGVEGTVHF
jgi:iron complex outermembrane receptor protein